MKKNAFTIIELLIVIVIISILTTITVLAYSGFSNKATVSSIQADLTNAKKALLSFQTTSPTNSFPTAINCVNPSATEICIKTSSSSTTLNYVSSGTGTSSAFSLIASNGDNLYNVTNTSANPTIYPNIVQNGLVLFLDAANPSSYPGIGSTWYDLSGKGRNITLYSSGGSTFTNYPPSSPEYNNDGFGKFNMDGINDWGYFKTAFSIPAIVTTSFWMKFTNTKRSGLLSHCNSGPVGVIFGVNGGKMEYHYYSGAWLSALSTSLVNDGAWHNIVFAKSGTILNMYIDGVLDSSQNVASQSFNIKSIASGYGPCSSEGYGPGSDSYGSVFPGSIGTISVYEKQLTPSEITQNFNALRGRYGI